jgi:hypothetical protein
MFLMLIIILNKKSHDIRNYFTYTGFSQFNNK